MAEVWINGGNLARREDLPDYAVVEYTDGLVSDIPNEPVLDDAIAQEEQEEEEKKEE